MDEVGIDTFLYRPYGWSERGMLVHGIQSGRKFQRTGIVAAHVGSSVVEPLQYNGTMDSILFETWFETRLLPAIPKKSVIVMDNASFHRKDELFALTEKAGCTLIFLPPYSPELNRIEKFWAWLKGFLRKILPDFQTLDAAICSAFHVY